MSAKFLPSLFASVAASFLLLGCQVPAQRADMPAPFGSLAHITSISPDTTQVLRSGEQVKLKVDVSYVLTAESGTIKLVVLAAEKLDGFGHRRTPDLYEGEQSGRLDVRFRGIQHDLH